MLEIRGFYHNPAKSTLEWMTYLMGIMDKSQQYVILPPNPEVKVEIRTPQHYVIDQNTGDRGRIVPQGVEKDIIFRPTEGVGMDVSPETAFGGILEGDHARFTAFTYTRRKGYPYAVVYRNITPEGIKAERDRNHEIIPPATIPDYKLLLTDPSYEKGLTRALKKLKLWEKPNQYPHLYSHRSILVEDKKHMRFDKDIASFQAHTSVMLPKDLEDKKRYGFVFLQKGRDGEKEPHPQPSPVQEREDKRVLVSKALDYLRRTNIR